MKTTLAVLAFIAVIGSAPAYADDQLPPARRPTAEEDAASYAHDREILRERRMSGIEDRQGLTKEQACDVLRAVCEANVGE